MFCTKEYWVPCMVFLVPIYGDADKMFSQNKNATVNGFGVPKAICTFKFSHWKLRFP